MALEYDSDNLLIAAWFIVSFLGVIGILRNCVVLLLTGLAVKNPMKAQKYMGFNFGCLLFNQIIVSLPLDPVVVLVLWAVGGNVTGLCFYLLAQKYADRAVAYTLASTGIVYYASILVYLCVLLVVDADFRRYEVLVTALGSWVISVLVGCMLVHITKSKKEFLVFCACCWGATGLTLTLVTVSVAVSYELDANPVTSYTTIALVILFSMIVSAGILLVQLNLLQKSSRQQEDNGEELRSAAAEADHQDGDDISVASEKPFIAHTHSSPV